MSTLPIEELRKLLTALSEHGSRHLIDVDADLKQAAFIMNEAIEQLNVGFLSLDKKQNEQYALISEIGDAEQTAADQAALKKLREEINQQTQQVVTSMQFQDMSNQIIERCMKRVNGLKAILDELGTHGEKVDASHLANEKEDIAAYISNIKQNLHKGSDAITGEINVKSVRQKDMSSGSIELF